MGVLVTIRSWKHPSVVVYEGSEAGEEAGGLLGGVGADLGEVDAGRDAVGDEYLAGAADDVGGADPGREGDVPRRVDVVVRPGHRSSAHSGRNR